MLVVGNFFESSITMYHIWETCALCYIKKNVYTKMLVVGNFFLKARLRCFRLFPDGTRIPKTGGSVCRVDAEIGSCTNIYVFAFLLTSPHELPRLQEQVRRGHRNISYPPKLRVYTAWDTIFPLLEPDKLREQIVLGKCRRTHIHTHLQLPCCFKRRTNYTDL